MKARLPCVPRDDHSGVASGTEGRKRSVLTMALSGASRSLGRSSGERFRLPGFGRVFDATARGNESSTLHDRPTREEELLVSPTVANVPSIVISPPSPSTSPEKCLVPAYTCKQAPPSSLAHGPPALYTGSASEGEIECGVEEKHIPKPIQVAVHALESVGGCPTFAVRRIQDIEPFVPSSPGASSGPHASLVPPQRNAWSGPLVGSETEQNFLTTNLTPTWPPPVYQWPTATFAGPHGSGLEGYIASPALPPSLPCQYPDFPPDDYFAPSNPSIHSFTPSWAAPKPNMDLLQMMSLSEGPFYHSLNLRRRDMSGQQPLIGLGIFEHPGWMDDTPSPSRLSDSSSSTQAHEPQNTALAELVKDSEPLGPLQSSAPMLPPTPVELSGYESFQMGLGYGPFPMEIGSGYPWGEWSPDGHYRLPDAIFRNHLSWYQPQQQQLELEPCSFCGEPFCLDPSFRPKKRLAIPVTHDEREEEDPQLQSQPEPRPRQIIEYYDPLDGCWVRAPPGSFTTSKFGAVGERLARVVPEKVKVPKPNRVVRV